MTTASTSRSERCTTAVNSAVAIPKATRVSLHEQCDMEDCACACHRGVDIEGLTEAPVAVSGPSAAPARKDRTGAVPAPNGRCQCGCGRTTGGRFAPGHDAKLKSLLWSGAIEKKSHKDIAELMIRGWFTGPKTADVDIYVEAAAAEFKQAKPDLVVLRTNYRQEHAPDTTST